MHLKHGPDNTAGDTIASTNHPECPPDGAAGEPLVNNDNPEDGPEGHPTATTGPQDDHQTPTLAVHIQKHEDIETAAQDRADATVEKIRRETERTYHLEFDRAIREIRSDQNRNFNRKLDETIAQFRETLEALAMEYSGKLQDLETGNQGKSGATRPADGAAPGGDQTGTGKRPPSTGKSWTKPTAGGSPQQPRTPGGNGRNSSSSTGRSAPTPPQDLAKRLDDAIRDERQKHRL